MSCSYFTLFLFLMSVDAMSSNLTCTPSSSARFFMASKISKRTRASSAAYEIWSSDSGLLSQSDIWSLLSRGRPRYDSHRPDRPFSSVSYGLKDCVRKVTI